MISLLAVLFAQAVAEPIMLVPTDDMWIYEHASDQVGDEYLRAWGAEGGPLGSGSQMVGEFSFSCMKFELPAGIDPAQVESAKLQVHSISDVNWSAEDSKATPLEARRMTADFDEKKWSFSQADSLTPKRGEEEVFGFGSGTPGDEKPFLIEIDLLKGKADFREALKEKGLKIALTTAMNPQDAAGSTYKVYSRNAKDEALRPKLVLTFK